MLSPPNDLAFIRTWMTDAAPASRSCSPALPACSDPNKVDVDDLMTDLIDPDVQAAFAMPAPALFGSDARPADGAVYQIARSIGGVIQVGGNCPTSGSAGCRPIPAGVAQLAADLRNLIERATTASVCDNITRPFPL
jgi:hypothetical protein